MDGKFFELFLNIIELFLNIIELFCIISELLNYFELLFIDIILEASKTNNFKSSFRVVWGSMSLGLCEHFPHLPCVHMVILRDPIERAISQYNYVCVLGKEGAKIWKKDWVAQTPNCSKEKGKLVFRFCS